MPVDPCRAQLEGNFTTWLKMPSAGGTGQRLRRSDLRSSVNDFLTTKRNCERTERASYTRKRGPPAPVPPRTRVPVQVPALQLTAHQRTSALSIRCNPCLVVKPQDQQGYHCLWHLLTPNATVAIPSKAPLTLTGKVRHFTMSLAHRGHRVWLRNDILPTKGHTPQGNAPFMVGAKYVFP